MKYMTAHPKIKELVAKNYFTTDADVERNLSMGAQTLVCSEFFEEVIRVYGSKIIKPVMEFLTRYIGTHPHVGIEWGSWSILEFCTFLADGSRDGIQLRLDCEPRVIDGEELTIKLKIVQLVGIFGVTTEKVLKEIVL